MRDPAIRGLLIRLLREPADLALLQEMASWTSIRENAGRLGVAAPIAFIARPHVDSEARKWCDQILIRSWDRYNKSLRDLEDAARILDDADIPWIPLKGPFLAWRAYQPPFLRQPSCDLDLAIRNKDLERGYTALAKAGFVLQAPIREAREQSHHLTLLHASKTRLELHFRLSHGACGIPIEEFFERAVETALPSGRRVLALDPADELLHLALHLASDRFRSLFHLYELRRLWSAAPEQIREQVVRSAVDRGFAGAIALTDIGFRLRWNEPFLPPGATLPKTWLHWRVNEQLYESLENWFEPGRSLSTRLRGRWLDLQSTDRAADILRLLPILGRVARSRLKRREWGAVPPRHYLTPRE